MDSKVVRLTRLFVGPASVILLIALAAPAGAAARSTTAVAKAAGTTHRMAPVRRHGRAVVFKLIGIRAGDIESAHLRARHYRKKLSLHRARAGARRGMLRLRLPHRVARTRGLRLVIVAHRTAVRAAATTISPSADAYVNAAKKDSNYGSVSTVWLDGSPIARTYLRFDVPSSAGPVSRALLKLYAKHGPGVGLDVRPVSNTSWNEKTITYSNAPAVGAVAASSAAIRSGSWVSVDVTSLVKGSGALSLALTTPSSSSIGLFSREAGANAPQLSIETGTAPTAPTNLQASATQTSLASSWTASTDDVGVAGYGLYVDGTYVGTTPGTSHAFSGLACGRSYTLAVDAYDAGGNRSAKASLGAATLACAAPGGRYAVRGVYDRDIAAQAAIGFNYIDSSANRYQMDELAALGLKGFVWLKGYSNTTCTFNYSDDYVRSHVAAIAGHPGVGAYMIDDEPDAAACPSAPAQIKARSDLVKSIDPGPPTFIVTYKVEQFKLFAGTVDLLALDHYPCSHKYGCVYSKIDAQAAEADRLGVRYWGVLQTAEDSWYRMPTAEELHQQFVHWRATNMEGYLVFAWRWPDDNPSLWLANNPVLLAQLALENAQ